MDTWVQLYLSGFWHIQCPLKPFVFQKKEREMGFPLSCSWCHHSVTQNPMKCRILFVFLWGAIDVWPHAVRSLLCGSLWQPVLPNFIQTWCHTVLKDSCLGFSFGLRRTPLKQTVPHAAIWPCIVSCTGCPGAESLSFYSCKTVAHTCR